MKSSIKELELFAVNIRKAALRAIYKFGAGHVGGSMSMADVMAALYGEVMNIDPKNPQWEERDWLITSKGHCGPAVYGTLALKGFFPMDWLDTMNKPGTNLPSHTDRLKTPGVDMTTGSLGQGLSAAVGIAWGHRYQNRKNWTFCITGDGELDEGQIWEAALFAATKKVANLIVFVDANGKQLDGYTKDIADLGDIRQKFEDFGWDAQAVDGHDIGAILDAIEKAKKTEGKPHCIVLNTKKGKDCAFVENEFYNHHVTVNEEQYNEAIACFDARVAELESEVAK